MGDFFTIPDVGISVTSVVTSPLSPTMMKLTVPFTSFETSGFSTTVPVVTLPPKSVVMGAIMKHTQPFSGGIIATCTLSLGVTGNLIKYCPAYNCMAPVSDTAFGALSSPILDLQGFTTGPTVVATCVTTVANTLALTQGSVDIYILVAQLP